MKSEGGKFRELDGDSKHWYDMKNEVFLDIELCYSYG